MDKQETVLISEDRNLFSPVLSEHRHIEAKTDKQKLCVNPYVPSKWFVSHVGENRLTAIGSVLFTFVSKLGNLPAYDDLTALRAQLVHEVKAFESGAVRADYPLDQVILARYVICATLDECIGKTSWGKTADWTQASLVKLFQDEESAGDRVFILLDRLRQTPSEYIDLIEFFYLCLSLGFEGKYAVLNDGKASMDRLLDDLYAIIRHERGDGPVLLSVLAPESACVNLNPSTFVSFKRVLLSAGIILLLIYISFIVMLHMEVEPIGHLVTKIVSAQP